MEKQPYRVLQVVTIMNRGGAETMVMNHYRAVDRSRVQFDFLVHRKEKGDYDEEIEAMGGRIFRAFPIRPWTYCMYFRWLDRFFGEHKGEFTAVHGHIQENSGMALKYAKKHGVINLISSSHIANLGLDYKYLFRKFGRILTKKYTTTRLACGLKAGKFLYEDLDFKLLNNAIDAKKYLFSHQVRSDIRNQFGLNDHEILIGNIARFCPQKNHAFILKCFAETLKFIPNGKLMLVGTGPLIDETKSLAQTMGISDKVIFTGLRSDVPNILQAFDVFFMPSLYEGLPVSVVEAQAAGLSCVLSDTIDKDCDVTGRVSFLSLNQPVVQWAKALEKAVGTPRVNTTEAIKKAGYDVHENLKFLLPLYGIEI